MEDFVTIADISSALGYTDQKMNFLLKLELERIIERVGDFSFGIKTERFLRKSINRNRIPVKCINPTRLISINGVDCTKLIEGKDYLILDNGEIYVNNFWDYTKFGELHERDYRDEPYDEYTEVVYEAGLKKADASLISGIAYNIQTELNLENGREVVREQLGPRSVQFAESSSNKGTKGSLAGGNYKFLSRYIPIHLRVF